MNKNERLQPPPLPEKLTIPGERLPLGELWYAYLMAKELRNDAAVQKILAIMEKRVREFDEKGTLTL